MTRQERWRVRHPEKERAAKSVRNARRIRAGQTYLGMDRTPDLRIKARVRDIFQQRLAVERENYRRFVNGG